MRFLRNMHLRGAAMLASTLVVAGCGGGSAQADLPRLGAATGATFTGACADLSGKLGALANTTITASTSVPSGSLTVAGLAVPEHCLVTGRMFDRVSADGILIAGMHLHFPAFSRLARRGDAYALYPEAWVHNL